MARTGWTETDQSAFTKLCNDLVAAASNPENQYPQSFLTPEDCELLCDAFDWDEIAAQRLLQRWAEAIGGRDIKTISPTHRSLTRFRKEGTKRRRVRIGAEENALAVAEASMRRRNRASAQALPDQMDAEALINSRSQALMATGYLLRERRGRLWYDDFYRCIRLDWGGSFDTALVEPYEVNDQALLRIKMWLRSLHSMIADASDHTLDSAIQAAADMDHRNEPADWLRGLKWDKVPRLETVLQRLFKAQDTAFNRDIGRNLFVGIVARILRPGVKLDTMVVLRGGQGLNKSTACQIIGGKWYAESHANVDSKDFIQELRALMILEVPELHSFVATRVGAARIKSMLSTRQDRYRPVWGRTVQTFPRTLVLIGTTNDQAFHNDPTGGRRFWIVDITGLIDLEGLEKEREQLFAEAVELYKAGATWWEVPEDEQKALVESATAVSYIQERLEGWIEQERIWDGTNAGERVVGGVRYTIEPLAPSLERTADDVPANWGTLLTTERIAFWMKVSIRDIESGQLRGRVVEALRNMGFNPERLKVAPDGKKIRVWLRANPAGTRIERATADGRPADIPF